MDTLLKDNVAIESISESSILQFKLVVDVLFRAYFHHVEKQDDSGGSRRN